MTAVQLGGAAVALALAYCDAAPQPALSSASRANVHISVAGG